MSEPKEIDVREKEEGPSADVEDVREGGAERKTVDYWEEGVLRNKIAQAVNVVLPNVKELTKKFAKGIEEFNAKPGPSPSAHGNGIPGPRKERALGVKIPTAAGGKVSPCNSVTSRGNFSVDEETKTNEVRDEVEEEGENKKPEGLKTKEAIKVYSSTTFGKPAGKEVHSLTARSISKEFREELKNNLSRSSIPQVDRGSSGESNHVEVVSENMRNKSPTPTIDLQGKRKFWEDIISNSQKKSTC